MALSPETIDALEQALTAVIEEAGDDPEHAGLVEALSAAQEQLGGGEAEGEVMPEDDPESFEHAEKKFAERRRPAPVEPAA